jgi:hypothetical protein
MHTIRLTIAASLAWSGVAFADNLPPLPVNPPSQCVALMSQLPAVGARISTANCLARERLSMTPVTVANLETANALATAVAPSIALYDNVIALHDPYWSIIAEDARRDTYESLAVRLRNAVQPDDQLGRVQAELLVSNWLDNVNLAALTITAIAQANPELANHNSTIAAITNRAASGTAIATRGGRR